MFNIAHMLYSHNPVYENYKLINFTPNFRDENNCNLEQTIQTYLERMQPLQDITLITDAADRISKNLCCKDCSKCKL